MSFISSTPSQVWGVIAPAPPCSGGNVGPAAGRRAHADKTLRSRDIPLAFSLASLWEVAIKTSLGRPDFSVDPGLPHRALLGEGFVEVAIAAPHLVRVATRPWVHRDPFDRLLVAQAMEDKLTLLTANATFKRYGRFVKLV